MKKHLLLFICILFVLLIAACSKSGESEDKGNKLDDTSQQEEESGQSVEENEKEVMAGLGDMEVKISGEAIVSENGIKIEGMSNLLPGTRISSHGVNDIGFASIAVQDVTEVQDDGTFTFEFEPLNSDIAITLRVYGDSNTLEHYGDNFDKVTGPQKYATMDHGKFHVKVDFEVEMNKEMPYAIPIEIPNWDVKPDDYGAPEVWMKAEVDSDHRYLYFRGKSNLVEGSRVGGNVRHESGIIEPFAFGFTHVNPDGSFVLRVPYHALRPGMYMPIRLEPKNNNWDDVVEAYGKKGEKLKGDLVGQEDDEQYVELIVPIVAPDFNPPEDVGLTVEEKEVKIQMPDHLLFDFDESNLKPEAQKTLDGIIADLRKLDEGTEIHINGHTDNIGDPNYNLNLSEERANAVWNYLQENVGEEKLNVTIHGYGDTQPIASNEDSEGQERNRRVEIVINPK